MKMKHTDKSIGTGRGIHARPRVSITARQPLKPKFSAQRMSILVCALGVCLSLLVLQNFNEIAHFLNRPITKVKMDVQWQQLSEAEMRLVLQDSMGKGFFDTDVAQIKSDVEQNSWVAQASVKRIWPDTINLQITEHVAIARWGNNQLLNQFGDAFTPADISSASHLPRLQGPAGSQFQVMQQFQQFSQIMFPAGLKISELTLSSRGSWDLVVNETLQIAVGRSDFTEKLERFVDFYVRQSKTNATSFEAIDLRYGNGIAVRSKEQDLTRVAIR